MTQEAKQFLKMNWITVANLLLLIGIIVQQSKWQQNVDNKIDEFENHAIDKEMHMPFKDKIEIFVPRVELDGRLKNIEATLLEIKTDLKKNLEK